jgi:hypothetical protein
MAMVGDEYNLKDDNHYYWEDDNDTTTATEHPNNGTMMTGGGPTYPTPLSLESWQLREWLGLTLCVLTVLAASGLTLVSNPQQIQRQPLPPPSGCFLTEQGVGELLQVGWRYHHHADNDQIVLQVFDKGSSSNDDGYNNHHSNHDHCDGENEHSQQHQQSTIISPINTNK